MAQKKYNMYEISDILQHNAVLTISDNIGKDYGTGKKYTPMEAHTVSYIGEHPGCTSAEIAYNWGKTPGAVSHIIKKLRAYGLVNAYRDPSDEKKVLLTLTAEGKELNLAHRTYDEASMEPIFQTIRQQFTEDEINNAFHILEIYVREYCKFKVKK